MCRPTTDGIVIAPTDFPYRERRDSAEATSADLFGCDDYGAISVNRVLVSKPKSNAQIGCVAKPPFYPLNYGDV